MSETAETITEGLLCEQCGVLIDGDLSGFPRNCASCSNGEELSDSPSRMDEWTDEIAGQQYDEEKVAYVQMRAKSDETITTFFQERDGNLSKIDDFVDYAVSFRRSLLEETSGLDIDVFTNDEITHIMQKKGCSKDVVEIVLWFDECYDMSQDNITLLDVCRKCAHDGLLEKEDEETLFVTYYVCELCKERYSVEEIFNID